MSFLEFYHNKLILDFNLDNIGVIPILSLIIFCVVLMFFIINLCIKKIDSEAKTTFKLLIIGLLTTFIWSYVFFGYSIKNIYTSIFHSQEKTNYINYLDSNYDKNNDFKKIYSYMKHLKENNDKNNIDWDLLNEVSLVNTKYYFNDFNGFNNDNHNILYSHFENNNYKVFSKEFRKNYKYFYNIFIFTEMMFIDKNFKQKVNNVITEIEKDNVITNREFFYLLNNVNEYTVTFDEYLNKIYSSKGYENKEMLDLEKILSDKEKQNKFLNYLLKWSNDEMVIKDEKSFYERSVLRNLNRDYFIKYIHYVGKGGPDIHYNFSFDTDELFTTLNSDKYKSAIKMLIKNINDNNNVSNQEFINLINTIYIYIIQERQKENKIYNKTPDSVYYTF